MPYMSYAYASLVLAIIYGAVNLIAARDLSRPEELARTITA